MHLRSIYYKFVLGYFIFGLLGFISISNIGSRMILNHLLESQVDALYNEATVIAEQCSSPYQGSKVAELSSVFPQLQAVSVYLKADIWVVNRKGTIKMCIRDRTISSPVVNPFLINAWRTKPVWEASQ